MGTSPGRTAESSWDAAAATYDLQLGLERPALRAAVALAAPAADEAVLDLATGTGAVLRALAALPRPPREVVGADRSPAMLARVETLPAGWRTVLADAERLPFPAAGFDLAFAAYLLHLLEPGELDAVLAELSRVVRPGGRLVTITPWLPRTPAGMAWRGLAALVQAKPDRPRVLRSLDPRPALGAAGFDVVRARRVTRGYPSLVALAVRRR